MVEELYGDVFVGGVVIGEPQRHFEHVEAEFRHPGGAVGLFQDIPVRKHRRAVERTDIVEPEKPSLEQVVAVARPFD